MPVSEGCKVTVAKCRSCAFRREWKTQPATRNFFRFSFGVRVCVCVPYIYKIKIKKIIYYIELRCTRPRRVVKIRPQKRERNRVAGCVWMGVKLSCRSSVLVEGNRKHIRDFGNRLFLYLPSAFSPYFSLKCKIFSLHL